MESNKQENQEQKSLQEQKPEQKTLETVEEVASTRKDIADLLLEKKIITKDQLDVALKEKQEKNLSENIGTILVNMGFITDSMLTGIINEQTGNKDFNLKTSIIDQRLVRKIPKGFAIQNKVIPVSFTKNTITVAISDLYDIITLDQLKRYFPPHFRIVPVFATANDILAAVDKYYDYEMSIDGILREIEGIDEEDINEQESMSGDYKSPMVRLVDALLTDAVRSGASDLHFEPEDFFLRLRYRINGKMEQIRTFHNKYWSAIN